MLSPMATSDSADLTGLTPEQRAWILADEQLWRRAHRAAERHPGVDVAGIYRVLRNLDKPPSERLRAALHHGRLFRVHSP